MGKPFEAELTKLDETYAWAKTYPIPGLSATFGRSTCPLIAVGSGGSYTTAHFAAALYQERLGQFAKSRYFLDQNLSKNFALLSACLRQVTVQSISVR